VNVASLKDNEPWAAQAVFSNPAADAGSIDCGWTLEINSPVAPATGGEAFTVYLSSAQQVPTNASTGQGRGCISINAATQTMSYRIDFTGLSSAQTLAHIHNPAPVGTNTGDIVSLGTVGGTSGVISGTAAVTPTIISHILSGQAYVDIHTVNFPDGEIRGQIALKRPVDYDGDGRTDFSILRFPSDGSPPGSPLTYWNLNSFTGMITSQVIGNSNTDFAAPGDYDGDCLGDLALYRSGQTTGADNFYLVLKSSDSTLIVEHWGLRGDISVARDYDGDGITDMAVFRRGAAPDDPAFWYIRQSAFGNALRTAQWGTTGDGLEHFDTPVPGDYDGDGKFDLAVYRTNMTPSNTYIIQRSSDNTGQYVKWGQNGDYLVPSDYDGDGKFDFGAARPGAGVSSPIIWYILRSSDGGMSVSIFGRRADQPVQGDYDGDGRADIAVYREGVTTSAQSTFYYIASLDNTVHSQVWGLGEDAPVATFDAH
jgi:hypothetical protein